MDYNKLTNEELIGLKKEKEKEFRILSFSQFVFYGYTDVALLIEIDQKLKLLDLAKFIAYTCGVTLSDIHGTIKQWNSFMYNRCIKENMLLPMESTFPSTDTVLLEHAMKMEVE